MTTREDNKLMQIKKRGKRKKLYNTANDPQTGNDPQIGPQIIPSPMWPQMIPPENVNGTESGFLDFLNFFLIFVFIYFHVLNDELDEHKETIFWQRKLQFKYISPDKFHLIFAGQFFRKITGKNQSSETAIPFLNKLDLQQL